MTGPSHPSEQRPRLGGQLSVRPEGIASFRLVGFCGAVALAVTACSAAIQEPGSLETRQPPSAAIATPDIEEGPPRARLVGADDCAHFAAADSIGVAGSLSGVFAAPDATACMERYATADMRLSLRFSDVTGTVRQLDSDLATPLSQLDPYALRLVLQGLGDAEHTWPAYAEAFADALMVGVLGDGIETGFCVSQESLRFEGSAPCAGEHRTASYCSHTPQDAALGFRHFCQYRSAPDAEVTRFGFWGVGERTTQRAGDSGEKSFANARLCDAPSAICRVSR